MGLFLNDWFQVQAGLDDVTTITTDHAIGLNSEHTVGSVVVGGEVDVHLNPTAFSTVRARLGKSLMGHHSQDSDGQDKVSGDMTSTHVYF